MLIIRLRTGDRSQLYGYMLQGYYSKIVLIYKNLHVLKAQHQKPFVACLGGCNRICTSRPVLLVASDKPLPHPLAVRGVRCTAQPFQAAQACSSCWWQCCMQRRKSTSVKTRNIVFLWCEYAKPLQGQKAWLCRSIRITIRVLCFGPSPATQTRTKSSHPNHGDSFLGNEREHFWVDKLRNSAVAVL